MKNGSRFSGDMPARRRARKRTHPVRRLVLNLRMFQKISAYLDEIV